MIPGALKFLIIAGPYEADLIRRAAVAAGCEAIAIEAGDSLSGWVSAARPDAIVVTSRAVKSKVTETVEALRALPGGNVPIVMLCDANEQTDADAAADMAFVRPVAPQAVVEAARGLVERRRASQVPPPVQGELAQPGSSPAVVAAEMDKAHSSVNEKAPSEPRLRSLSPDPSGLRGLAPLMVERRRSPTASPQTQPLPPPFARRLSDSIDQALDAEMERTLSTVAPLPGGRTERLDETTREVPQAFVNTILADAHHVLGTASPLTDLARVGRTKRTGFPAAGELAQTSVAMLLGLALQEGATGRLRLRHGDCEKSVFFEAGRPVLAVSSAIADRMVQMLVRQGTVTNDQAKTAIDVATQTGRRMGAVLVDLGFIKSAELLPAVRQHYEEIVFSLFAWGEGSFRFESGATADPRRVRLLRHPAALVMEGILRSHDEGRLHKALGRDELLRLEPGVGGPDVLLEVSGGDPAVSRIPVLFDGVRPLSEVVRASAQPRVVVLQVAVVLRCFGLLVPVRSGESTSSVPEGVTSRDREIDRERIAARAALVHEGDYFHVLGVPPNAGVGEVRQAYERISRELSAASVGSELATELAVALEEIRGAVEEAYVVLTDEGLRQAYVTANAS